MDHFSSKYYCLAFNKDEKNQNSPNKKKKLKFYIFLHIFLKKLNNLLLDSEDFSCNY